MNWCWEGVDRPTQVVITSIYGKERRTFPHSAFCEAQSPLSPLGRGLNRSVDSQ
jgi:hypothetical protein